MSTNGNKGAGSMSIDRADWLLFATQAAERLFAEQEEAGQDARQLGAYLRRLRYRRGLGLDKLSTASGLSVETLALLEQGMLGTAEVDTDTWSRLMRLLDGREPATVAATGRPSRAVPARASSNSHGPSPSNGKGEAVDSSMPAAAEHKTGPAIGVARIKVIGVGGGGSNAVARMFRQRVPGVEYAVVNTDIQHLKTIEVPVKLRIGDNISRGLGVGGRPEVGREAALESRADIEELVKDTDMVFIACGMGGGTGTGAAPVVAEIAKESGALTIAAVTKPFAFEGRRRMRQAEEGISHMRPNADTLIIIPNDRLSAVSDENMTAENAFRLADDVLRQGVQSIAELITVPGEINLDFADVKTVMQGSGPAWMAIGQGRGDQRAVDAAKAAMASPLLDIPVDGATRVLLNIAGGPDMTLHEVHQAADYVARQVDPDANIIFGMVTDMHMDEEIRVTVIATGLRNHEELFNEAVAKIAAASEGSSVKDAAAVPSEPVGDELERAHAEAQPVEQQDETSGLLRFFGLGRRKPKN